MSTQRIRAELFIVLLITFGMQGVRSVINVLRSLAAAPLNEQSTTIVKKVAANPWLDLLYQLLGAAVQIGWGLLVVYLLYISGTRLKKASGSDVVRGMGLAALIGLSGLGFYVASLHFGLAKQVLPGEPASGVGLATSLVAMTGWAVAAAVAEETVVVAWLCTRLEQLRTPAWLIIVLSALLRGSYHLYQGVAGGVGNLIMGVLFSALYLKTRRIWPLIIAHFIIDFVAFVGYQLLAPYIVPLLAQVAG